MTIQPVAQTGVQRMPGLFFEAAPAVRTGVLPRMDVTAFVGYAEAGPLDTPVLVEDPARFREVFGGEVVLASGYDGGSMLRPAWDHSVTGLLAPTVQAFFDNGGHSCWVVRVGEGAETARFVVPGLVRVDPAVPAGMRPVVLQARSPGSYFDQQAAVARIRRRSLPTLPGSLFLVGWVNGQVVVPGSIGVTPGDLLELVLDGGRTVWTPVRTIRDDAAGQRILGWPASEEAWLEPVRDVTATGQFAARVLGPDGATCVTVESVVVDADGAGTLVVPLPVDQAPTTGDVLVVNDGTSAPLLLGVSAAPVGDPVAGPDRCLVRGWPAWRLLRTSDGRGSVAPLDRAAVLELDLASRQGDAVEAGVQALGFTAAHPRWFGHLPTDELLFGRRYEEAATGGMSSRPGPVDLEATNPRFPLAAPPDLSPVCLPLGLGLDYGSSGIRTALVERSDPLQRNGLARRDAAPFLDPELAGYGAETLLEAGRRRFLVEGKRLLGLHSLLPLEDVAVVAAPDVLHGEWRLRTPEPSPVVAPPVLAFDQTSDELGWEDPFADLEPEQAADGFVLQRSATADFSFGVETTVVAGAVVTWLVDRGRCGQSHHRVRAQRRGVTTAWSNTVRVSPARGAFDACDVEEHPVPVLVVADLLLTWTPTTTGPFQVQRSPHPLFEHAIVEDRTTVAHLPLVRPGSTTYARVRSVVGELPRAWSNTVVVSAVPEGRWLVTEPAAAHGMTTSEPALAVHRALATMAAARRDLTVLLSFPRWYGAEAVERHLGVLAEGDAAVGLDRLHAHHPWLLVTTEAGPRPLPADGAVAGRLARDSLDRGPWIATAGTPLTGVIGIVADRADVELLRLRSAQVNGLRRTRTGVVVTGVDTLARELDVRPVTVRRLLMLVRRLALREGRALVFEPNGPDLRRLLQTQFESVMGLLFRLGALAGQSPAEAYRVLCDEGLNPPRVMDVGQVVIELQLAPSYPLEFLVVRLVQAAADGGFRLTEVA